MTFQVGDKVDLDLRKWALDSNGEPTIFVSWIVERAEITRVWSNGWYVTLRTVTGKTFVRHVDSASILPLA
jgi:hypothetical protein